MITSCVHYLGRDNKIDQLKRCNAISIKTLKDGKINFLKKLDSVSCRCDDQTSV